MTIGWEKFIDVCCACDIAPGKRCPVHARSENKPHKCPVCEGRGDVIVSDVGKVCHGCNGKGWVTV